MKNLFKCVGLVLGGLLVSMATSCSPIKEVLQPVVSNTYGVVLQIESYVSNSTNVVEDLNAIVGPLKIVSAATTYIGSVIDDQEKLQNVLKLKEIVDQLVLICESPETPETAKALVMEKLNQIKPILESIAAYIDLDLTAIPRAQADLGSILLKSAKLQSKIDGQTKHIHTNECNH